MWRILCILGYGWSIIGFIAYSFSTTENSNIIYLIVALIGLIVGGLGDIINLLNSIIKKL
jgi:hypothetical protein